MRRILAVAILAATTFHAVARDLPTASPESVGMSRERLDRIGAAMRRYVDEGKIAGMVTLVARHGKIVYASVVGKQDVTNNTAVARETLFRIYSMTKPITAVAAMTLYEEGRFQLKDPVSTFLPEFKDLKVFEDGQEVASKTPMTMQHLLSHTGGLAYGFDKENPVERQYWDRELLLSPDLTRIYPAPLPDTAALSARYTLVLQPFIGRRGRCRRTDQRHAVRSVPEDAPLYAAWNARHVLRRSGRRSAPVRPQLPLERRDKGARSVAGAEVSDLPEHNLLLRRRRIGVDGGRLHAILRNAPRRRCARRRAHSVAEDDSTDDHEHAPGGPARSREQDASERGGLLSRLRLRTRRRSARRCRSVCRGGLCRRIQLGWRGRDEFLGRPRRRHRGRQHDSADGLTLVVATTS